MRAYAVFAGGGAKGAALAGCLQAAQSQGVQFVAFGGTSAGSIVALLAAAGYTGEEIRAELTREPLMQLLDDQGRRLKAILRSCKIGWRLDRNAIGLWWLAIQMLGWRWTAGLYKGNRLRGFLCDLVRLP